MAESPSGEHLARLSTQWSLVLRAQGTGDAARTAQCEVLERYHRAVFNYLAAVTVDPHVAADLAQDFALRFVRGDFQSLDPGRGKFRAFLRTVLRNLVIDHFRARGKTPRALPEDSAVPAPEAGDDFDRRWRDELLRRSWEGLWREQTPDGPPYFDALKWRSQNPDRPTAEGAAALARPMSPDAFRQVVHRAREKFVSFLRSEVALTIDSTDPEAVDRELADLKLLAYCSR
jgi:RNA polymerase sigma-70 factor (ECF subfamily)